MHTKDSPLPDCDKQSNTLSYSGIQHVPAFLEVVIAYAREWWSYFLFRSFDPLPIDKTAIRRPTLETTQPDENGNNITWL